MKLGKKIKENEVLYTYFLLISFILCDKLKILNGFFCFIFSTNSFQQAVFFRVAFFFNKSTDTDCKNIHTFFRCFFFNKILACWTIFSAFCWKHLISTVLLLAAIFFCPLFIIALQVDEMLSITWMWIWFYIHWVEKMWRQNFKLSWTVCVRTFYIYIRRI